MLSLRCSVVFYMLCAQLFSFSIESISSFDDKVQNMNLRSLSWEDESWSADSVREWAQKLLDMQRSPTDYRKRVAAFSALSSTTRSNNMVITPEEWADLELLCGSKSKSCYLGSLLKNTQTEVGYAAFLTLLSYPTVDISLLTSRQRVIKKLLSSPDLTDFLSSCFAQLGRYENIALSFWDKNEGFAKMADPLYYSLPLFSGPLNRSTWALEVGNYFEKITAVQVIGTSLFVGGILPLWAMNKWGILPLPAFLKKIGDHFQHFRGGPLGPLFMVYDVLLQNKFLHTELAFIGGVCAFLGAKSQIIWRRDILFFEQCLQEKLIDFARYFEIASCIDEVLSPYHEDIKHIPGYAQFCQVMHILPLEDPQVKELYDLLKSPTFAHKPSITASRGNILRTFKLLCQNKEKIKPFFTFIGNLDAFCSCTRLYREHTRKRVSWCFPTYLEQETAYIELEQCWNPFISSDTVIPNNLVMGESAHAMVITGPNAGGKSTIMKGVALNAILAQTLGIAPARAMRYTPFSRIITYMNIADDICSGTSGFKAAVSKAQECLDSMGRCSGYSLLVMDEAFRETSPIEAQATSYSVTKEIGSYPRTIALIATHFDKVSTLADIYEDFINYKVSVGKKSDGSLEYSYKLLPGCSDQHIALDILRNEGFHGAIIDTAQEIIDEMKTQQGF